MNQQNNQQTPLGVAVTFSMAWLETQGQIGQQVAQTVNTLLLGNTELLQRIEKLESEAESLTASVKQFTSERDKAQVAYAGLEQLMQDPEYVRAHLSQLPCKPEKS